MGSRRRRRDEEFIPCDSTMIANRLVPARVAFSDGVPRSEQYDDVYYSADGAVGQVRHVFLAGNGFPERWRRREAFTILEIGFGLGLNFLATWVAFEAEAPPASRLHFVSVEKHPFTAQDLARLHSGWPELKALSRELCAAWPPLLPGFHRLHFEGGRITLTLLLGDAACLLPQLEGRVDAFYLDGFAPPKNPELWFAPLFAELARLAASGATLATWTVAGEVRTKLARAGFTVEKRRGFGRKREMLVGVYTGRHESEPALPSQRAHHAIIIGAGIAGASCSERLAARGWKVEVIERHSAPARGASGNPAGVLTPVLHLADTPNARVSCLAFLYAMRHFEALEREGSGIAWHGRGALRLAIDPGQVERLARIVEHHGYPDEFVRVVSSKEASSLAGWPVRHPGVWFPSGAWVQPASVCAANLECHARRIASHFNRRAIRIEPVAEAWAVRADDDGIIAEAPVVILANAFEAAVLAQARRLPLEAVRGQVTQLPAMLSRALDIAVCGNGYIAPTPGGGYCVGATLQHDDPDAVVRVSDHRENLQRLESLLPGFAEGVDPANLEGRVAYRATTPDRLPLAGPLPRVSGHDAGDASVTRWPGLYTLNGLGMRGLVWAPLCAEILAAQLNGEPTPVERDLAAALDPARFFLGGNAKRAELRRDQRATHAGVSG